MISQDFKMISIGVAAQITVLFLRLGSEGASNSSDSEKIVSREPLAYGYDAKSVSR